MKVTYKGTTYSSVRKAALALKFDRKRFTEYLKQGYTPDESVIKALEHKKNIKNKNYSESKRSRPVYINGKKFNSISAAARCYHISTTTIRTYMRDQKSDHIIIRFKDHK